MQQAAAVADTLKEIGATNAPIVTALNKIDRLADPDALEGMLSEFPNSIAVSARTGQGVDRLLARVEEVLNADLVPLRVRLPYQQGDLLALLHEHGRIRREEYGPQGTTVEGLVPARLSGPFRPFSI
jgi:GTP-binding protein HflX